MSNKDSHIKLGFRILGGIIFSVIVFGFGVYIGYARRPAIEQVSNVTNKTSLSVNPSADFGLFWNAWQIAQDKYVNPDKATDQDKVYGAIKGMLSSYGDPYTTFFSPKEAKMFDTQIAGEFEGIGAEIGQKDGVLTIIAPLKGTPAETAGIKAGDKLVKIDDKLADMDVDSAINLIRGKEGTTVKLTIVREGLSAPLVLTLTRQKIALPTVDTEVHADQKAFVIHLYVFSANSANLFADAMAKFRATGYHNLIIDLRNNPGGYLDAAVDMSKWFLPKGSVVVKEIGRNGDTKTHTSVGPGEFGTGYKIYIIGNKGSASASEILTGALTEHGVATLVGDTTFGKGSVQEVVPLDDNTAMKVTVAKWYTPNGISISENGLKPSIFLKPNESATIDRQLQDVLAMFNK
ncbi:MAG: S41 family peptidase [bacterium]